MFTRFRGAGKAGRTEATPAPPESGTSTKARGDAAESRALAWLQARGLQLVERNYRVARGPSARGGEIDLVMRDGDGTLVFVEVRQRAGRGHGGAAASVTATKQRRLVHAAQHYLLRFASPPPCRFDVLAVDGDGIEWLQAAFDA
jgi:putative endonuclease